MFSNRFQLLQDDPDSLSDHSRFKQQFGLNGHPRSRYTAQESAPKHNRPLGEPESWNLDLYNLSTPLRQVPATIERSHQRVSKRLSLVDDPPLAVLCDTCSAIFVLTPSELSLTDRLWRSHHRSQEALARAIQQRCFVCMAIGKRRLSQDAQIGQKVHRYGSDFLCELRYKIELSPHLEYTFKIALFTWEVLPDTILIDWVLLRQKQKPGDTIEPWAFGWKDDPRTVSTNSTSSRSVWDLCRYWVHTCRTNHTRCGKQKVNIEFTPTRLLHIRQIRGRVTARLQCRKRTDVPVEYVTLSHCWGQKEFFTLRRNNLQQAQMALTIHELPKVFQDAFHATLQLGYTYIWIDSLCIVQDSKDDWLAESALMGDIYKYSSCNIAATGFSDGGKGFFATRTLDDVSCPTITTQWQGKWRYTNEPKAGTYFLCDTNLFSGQVNEAPLNRRAWVLQERVLSPCVLHFGNKQVFWECFESRCSEVFPHGVPIAANLALDLKNLLLYGNKPAKNRTDKKSGPRIHSVARIRNKDNDWDMYDCWYSIVTHYSIGRLSRSEDKLLAISGIVKAFREISNDRYLSGLWEKDFIPGLVWERKYDAKVELPLGEYRAPTWSWASIDAQIDYHKANLDTKAPTIHARLVRCETYPCTSDPTGLVAGARAQMRGSLQAVNGLKIGYRHQPRAKVGTTEINIMTSFDLSQRDHSCTDSPVRPALSLVATSNGTLEVQMSDKYQDAILGTRQIFLFPLMSTYRDFDEKTITVGLLLVRSGIARGQYVRIGIFSLDEQPSRTAVLDSTTKRLAPDLWERHLGRGEYVISIF